jgi:hypothetical protein
LDASIIQWSKAGLHSEEEEFNSMHDFHVIALWHPYFIIDIGIQSRLAKETLKLLDIIRRSTGTQKQQPLFILSL